PDDCGLCDARDAWRSVCRRSAAATSNSADRVHHGLRRAEIDSVGGFRIDEALQRGSIDLDNRNRNAGRCTASFVPIDACQSAPCLLVPWGPAVGLQLLLGVEAAEHGASRAMTVQRRSS